MSLTGTDAAPDPGHSARVITAFLHALNERAPALASDVHGILGPVPDVRDELRARLLADNAITPIGDTRPPGPISMAAVDGALIVENLYAAELLIAAATAAEGARIDQSHPVDTQTWMTVQPHATENKRLVTAAMAGMELHLLTTLPHRYRLVDGAFGTPVISLARGLGSHDPRVRDEVAAMCRFYDLPAAVADYATQPTGTLIALPKADSKRRFADLFEARYGMLLPGGDKMLATQVLQPGEMLTPIRASGAEDLEFNVADDAPDPVLALRDRFRAAIQPLIDDARDGRLLVTYLKADNASAVTKMEYRGDPATGRTYARLIADECVPPILEPFPQYAVDRAAKQISQSADLIRRAVIQQLPAESAAYVQWLLRGYRT